MQKFIYIFNTYYKPQIFLWFGLFSLGMINWYLQGMPFDNALSFFYFIVLIIIILGGIQHYFYEYYYVNWEEKITQNKKLQKFLDLGFNWKDNRLEGEYRKFRVILQPGLSMDLGDFLHIIIQMNNLEFETKTYKSLEKKYEIFIEDDITYITRLIGIKKYDKLLKDIDFMIDECLSLGIMPNA